ncbi:MAG: SRPBCC domain-containing protein [Acetobacteraceae bacterium]
MHFEGEFSVPGKPADVIRRFSDVPRMATCMPGAVLEKQNEDGSWPGGMIVSFGPKKIKFSGRANVDFDYDNLTGSVHGRGTADMRAARIGVKVSFALREDPAAATPTTIVKIVSDADLGGVLADFARTGGIAVANAIMKDFARRAADEFAKDAPPPEPEAVAAGEATTEPRPAAGETVAEPRPAASEPAPVLDAATGPALEEPVATPAPIPAPPPPAPPRPAAQSQAAPQPAPALSAGSLFWIVVKAYLAKVGRIFGIGR